MKRKDNVCKRVMAFSLCLCAVTMPVARADDAVLRSPAPTGLHHVGARTMYLVDSQRREVFSNGGARELAVRFWYPASSGQNCQPASYASPGVWSYIAQLTGFPLPSVSTNSCEDAAILLGPHPLVVFSHGYTGMFTDETFLFEDLASRGYVVASVAHNYETTAVELQNGRIVKSLFGSYLAPASLHSDFDSLSRAFSVRLNDLKFVLDEMQNLNASSNSPFAGSLDLKQIAVMGHSLGGVAAIASLEKDSRVTAVVVIDPILLTAPITTTSRPVLILAAGRNRWSQPECTLWSRLRGPRLAVNLKGADHFTPSDAAWLFGPVIDIAEPADSIVVIREYVAAFLDTNLQGRPPRLLLSRPPAQFTDVAITTSKQALCLGSRTD